MEEIHSTEIEIYSRLNTRMHQMMEIIKGELLRYKNGDECSWGEQCSIHSPPERSFVFGDKSTVPNPQRGLPSN